MSEQQSEDCAGDTNQSIHSFCEQPLNLDIFNTSSFIVYRDNSSFETDTSTNSSLDLNRLIIALDLSDSTESIPELRMAYQNYFGTDASLMEMYPWYEVSTFLRTINEIRRKNFSLQEHRNQALELLNGMTTTAPYSETIRFPDGRYYICEGYGDWVRKIQQLRIALSYKDNSKDKKEKAQTDHENFGDAIVSFHNSLTSMLMQIRAREGVFSRGSFENHFGATWAPPGP